MVDRDLAAEFGLFGWFGLMAAAVAQAGVDMRQGDFEAADWLAVGFGEDMSALIGLDRKTLDKNLIDMLGKGCNGFRKFINSSR